MRALFQAWLPCAFAAISTAAPEVAAAAPRCGEFHLPIVLQQSSESGARPSVLQLVTDMSPSLRIVDVARNRILWTAGVAGNYTQRFAGMTAGFWSSLVAIDTDGDGVHDRIYAGDLQGRLWRLDIDARRPASTWVTGGIFADLSAVSGRGFLAAADITLIAPAGAKPWLSIALGTAYTGASPAMPGTVRGLNRFYVLRDRAPYAHWSQDQYDRWPPLVEHDLWLAEGAQVNAIRADGAGFYINLGTRQVIAPALTLDGTTFYTVAATSQSLLPTCDATSTAPPIAIVNVNSISTVDGALNAITGGTQPVLSAPADSAVTLRPDKTGTSGVVCAVAGQVLPSCSLDTTLRRSFWRREDAD